MTELEQELLQDAAWRLEQVARETRVSTMSITFHEGGDVSVHLNLHTSLGRRGVGGGALGLAAALELALLRARSWR